MFWKRKLNVPTINLVFFIILCNAVALSGCTEEIVDGASEQIQSESDEQTVKSQTVLSTTDLLVFAPYEQVDTEQLGENTWVMRPSTQVSENISPCDVTPELISSTLELIPYEDMVAEGDIPADAEVLIPENLAGVPSDWESELVLNQSIGLPEIDGAVLQFDPLNTEVQGDPQNPPGIEFDLLANDETRIRGYVNPCRNLKPPPSRDTCPLDCGRVCLRRICFCNCWLIPSRPE